MDAEVTVPMFSIERNLLAAYARNEGMQIDAYCRRVLNDHIRTRVGLPASSEVEERTDVRP